MSDDTSDNDDTIPQPKVTYYIDELADVYSKWFDRMLLYSRTRDFPRRYTNMTDVVQLPRNTYLTEAQVYEAWQESQVTNITTHKRFYLNVDKEPLP